MRITTEIYIAVALATLFAVLLVAIILVSIVRYYKRRQAHERALLAFEQVLLQSRLEIQEQTFTSIGQELHDNIGQLLSLAKLNLNTLNFAEPEKVKEKVEESTNLIGHSIQALRELAKSITGSLLGQGGLLAALEAEIRMIEKLGIMHAVFRLFGEAVSIDKDKSLIIFRIMQEALHNVLKHAAASVVELQVHFRKEEITVCVIDNGKGMQMGAKQADGSGLRNMHDRAKIIGATLKIIAGETGGTTVRLAIPHHK